MKKISLSFKIIFMLIVASILVLNIRYFTPSSSSVFIIGSLIFLGLFLMLYLYRQKVISKKSFTISLFIFIIIGILIRLFFINTLEFHMESDFQLAYDSAKSIMNNESLQEAHYLSYNGYFYIFSSVIAIFMSIVGTSISSLLLINVILSLLSLVFLYKIINIKCSKETSLFLSTLYFLLPNVILVNLLLTTENIFLPLFFLCIYLCLKIKREKYFSFILLGALMCFTNYIRPAMSVFLVSFIIYYIINTKKLKELSYLLVLILSFFLCSIGFKAYIQHNLGEPLNKGSLGWAVYYGSNYDYKGMWNIIDADVITDILNNSKNAALTLVEKSLERYKEYGPAKSLHLQAIKYKDLWKDSLGMYPFVDLNTSIDSTKYELSLRTLANILVIVLSTFTLWASFKDIKEKKDTYLILEIFISLYVLSNLFVCVNGRYNFLLYPILIICSGKVIDKFLKICYDNSKGSDKMKEKMSKLINVYKKYGFIGFCKKLRAYIIANYLDKISFEVMLNKKKYTKIIEDILATEDFDRIILWRSSFGYNVPLFQRPQHISKNLAASKCLVLYEVTTMTDNIKTIKKHDDNFYLVNFNNIALNKIITKVLAGVKKPKYVQVYSTDWKLSVENIDTYLKNGYKFIYEYVDHLSPELAGTKNLPQNIIDKYNYVLENKDIYVAVTADALEKEIVKKRGKKNLVFSCNGVDYNFFQEYDKNYKLDKEFTDILKKKKPIIMYYGALAKWFDYDLLKKIAKTNKYSVVLFGIKYDEAYDQNITDEENIYFLGAKDYKVLKYYAKKADCLTIPFLINDITKSTSPVKIFEYMAMHIPIVTTKMPECLKYKSVLTSKDHDEFLKNIEKALKLKNDKKYLDLETKEAKENEWREKALAIINLIKKDEPSEKNSK